MFKVGDVVTRKSYNNDIVFKIIAIEDDNYFLKGYSVRLYADSVKDDLVLVQANSSYSLAKFQRYTSNKIHEEKAEKWIIKNLQSDIDEFEGDFILG